MGSLPFNDLTKSPDNTPYCIEPNHWYQAYPYGFAYRGESSQEQDSATETFWLPIAPNNINVTTHFATNIVTTLYGIIEEHSEVRYYDITISGNTGIAPKYSNSFTGGGELAATDSGDGIGTMATFVKEGSPLPNAHKGAALTGREFFKPEGLVDFGGFLPEVANTINAAANLVKSIANGGEDSNETGITPTQSGYYAFHNFYRFLLRYKLDTSRTGFGIATGSLQLSLDIDAIVAAGGRVNRATHPLQFLNYKDSIKYDVIPISFTLTRSADNPMLYTYNIKMRAFNLQNVTAKPPPTNSLEELGLGSLRGSLFQKFTNVAGKASTLLSGLGGIL